MADLSQNIPRPPDPVPGVGDIARPTGLPPSKAQLESEARVQLYLQLAQLVEALTGWVNRHA